MASAKTTKTNRVFIDSSVLIAAAISNKGAARDLLLQGFRGQMDLYIAPEVLEETERNLALKAPQALADFHIFREFLLAKVADPPRRLVLSAAKVVALKDASIVAAAKKAGATYLATYDQKHLLRQKNEIRNRFGLVVARPDEVLGAGK